MLANHHSVERVSAGKRYNRSPNFSLNLSQIFADFSRGWYHLVPVDSNTTSYEEMLSPSQRKKHETHEKTCLPDICHTCSPPRTICTCNVHVRHIECSQTRRGRTYSLDSRTCWSYWNIPPDTCHIAVQWWTVDIYNAQNGHRTPHRSPRSNHSRTVCNPEIVFENICKLWLLVSSINWNP